jgi:hypothetical protein
MEAGGLFAFARFTKQRDPRLGQAGAIRRRDFL